MKKIYLFGGIIFIVMTILSFVMVIIDKWTFPFAGWLPWIFLALGSACFMSIEKEEKNGSSLLKLLFYTAVADGKLTDEEAAILASYANQFGLSQKQAEAIQEEINKEVANGKISMFVPSDMSEREKNIKALVKMAKVDGKIDPNEEELIKSLAIKHYGIDESYVNKLLA
jgi:uncharacterized tellurite resistance protein B-like protein